MKIKLKNKYKNMKNPKKFILAYNKSKRIQYIKKLKKKKHYCFLFYVKQKYRLEEKKKKKIESQKWVIGNREQKRKKNTKKLKFTLTMSPCRG